MPGGTTHRFGVGLCVRGGLGLGAGGTGDWALGVNKHRFEMLTWCPARRMMVRPIGSGDRVRLMMAGSDGALDQDLVALLLR